MATYVQPQPQLQRTLTEEKNYRIPYAEGAPLIRSALEHALGVEFEELAPGMWSGSKQADEYSFLDVTVRTLEVDDGTSVEVQLEHRYTSKAVTLFVIGITLGCFLLLPLIPTIWISHKLGKQHVRQRLVDMHKAWTEIGNAVGAPRKGSYRDAPKRAYEPARIAEPRGRGKLGRDAPADEEAMAEAEAEAERAEEASQELPRA